MTKHTCTCVNPKELVSDILHTANPDDLKARLDELGLTGQYLSALLRHFVAEFKSDIWNLDFKIEQLKEDQDEIRDRLAAVRELL